MFRKRVESDVVLEQFGESFDCEGLMAIRVYDEKFAFIYV